MFTYSCLTDDCDGEIEGAFGESVQCPVCGVWWETDWDYVDTDSMGAWITARSDDRPDGER